MSRKAVLGDWELCRYGARCVFADIWIYTEADLGERADATLTMSAVGESGLRPGSWL